MQRQSLGSPGSRHAHHVLAADADEDRRRSGRWSRGGGAGYDLTEAAVSATRDVIVEEDKEEERKSQLPRPPSPEMTVHLIPVLTLFCILVLFLISHDPSAKDLGQFEGSAALLHARDMDAAAATGLGRTAAGAESAITGVAAVARSHRRLKELEKERLRGVGGGGMVRSNRKLGAGFQERLRLAS